MNIETPRTDIKETRTGSKWNKLISLGGIGLVAATSGGCAGPETITSQQETGNQSALPNQQESAAPSVGALEPSPSSPVNITPLETAPVLSERELAVKALEIKAGQDIDTLGKALIERNAAWDMAGSEDATADKAIDAGFVASEKSQYVQTIVDKNTPIYAEATYGADWENNPNVAHEIDVSKQQNFESLVLHITSSDSAQPFMEWKDYESARQISGDTNAGTMEVDYVFRDNLKDFPKLVKLGAKSFDGSKLKATFSYKTVDGVIITESLNLHSR